MAGRIPPHSIDAEQSILGALLFDPNALDQVGDLITADDFFKPAHNKIFSAVKHLHAHGKLVDIITVSNHLTIAKQMEAIGGTEYLVELLNRTVSTVNISKYAEIVREKTLLRRLIQTGSSIIERALDQQFESVSAFMDQVEGEIFNLNDSKTTSGLTTADEIVKASLTKIEALVQKGESVTGIATGFTELDKMMAGMQPSEFIVIAARPSMGKTAFSLNIAQHIALREKKTVAYFSVEMSKESMMMRIMASEARISLSDIKTGRIPEAGFSKLISVAGSISEASLYIDDTSQITPFEIRARCRRLKARHSLDMVIIDYLQLMKMEDAESREREVAEISGALKALAKELQIPIVALAQLNRGVEGRTEKRPMLSDLRESGSIEQDADVIMMLYREGYYDREDPDKLEQAEVIIAKQRNGPTGTVKLRWEPRFGRFRDADNEGPPPLPPLPPSPNGPPFRNNQKAPQANGSPPGGKMRNFAPGANA